MSYPSPQTGYPQSFENRPPRPVNRSTIYSASILFLVGSASLIVAGVIGLHNRMEAALVLILLPGWLDSLDTTTTQTDATIIAGLITGAVIALLALILLTRLSGIRWVLAVVGWLITGYYGYTTIYGLSAGDLLYAAPVAVAMLLWLWASLLVSLPATGRAMRG